MKLNKDDIYGIVGSVAFHLFILLILGFTVLKTVVPDEDGGILVNASARRKPRRNALPKNAARKNRPSATRSQVLSE